MLNLVFNVKTSGYCNANSTKNNSASIHKFLFFIFYFFVFYFIMMKYIFHKLNKWLKRWTWFIGQFISGPLSILDFALHHQWNGRWLFYNTQLQADVPRKKTNKKSNNAPNNIFLTYWQVFGEFVDYRTYRSCIFILFFFFLIK